MGLTALILEDSKTQAVIIGKMVEACGWQTVICHDVREAMDSLQLLSVQALFLDIFVGERNTLKHYDRFRWLAGESPIALMSAGSRNETAEDVLKQARKIGADYVLRKPFTDGLIGDILKDVARAGAAKAKHVLVIDDSRTVCLFIRQALEAQGYRVSVAADMEAAFANIDIAHVDLVLCDVFMPGMGGLKGMRLIKRTWPKVKIVSMSAGMKDRVSSTDALNASRKIGVDAQIGKPFSAEDLVMIADMVLEAPEPEVEARRPSAAALVNAARRETFLD